MKRHDPREAMTVLRTLSEIIDCQTMRHALD